MTASPLVAVPSRLRSTASGNGTVVEMWEGTGQCGEIRAGGAEGIRTPDLLIANETLYQLSYAPNDYDSNLSVWRLKLTAGAG